MGRDFLNIFSCEMLDFGTLKCDLFWAYDFEKREAAKTY